jgi:tetratricopeptide (TPR) repeat protein/transcriptional regulator with XRE-family HTH domain
MADASLESLGTRLRREREKQGWTQQELAKKIEVSARSIGRWENGEAKPRQEQLDLLTEVFGKPHEEWGKTRARWNNVPPRNLFFTGRDVLLERLHWSLPEKRTLALSGLGGIGKTATVIEYAYRYEAEYEAILWVNADLETLVSDFAGLAAVLDLPERHEDDQSLATKAVKSWLQKHSSWLLIFDNADDLNLAYNYLPGGRGAVLLTTLAQETGPYFEKIDMLKMSRRDGTRFLLRRKYGDKAKLLASATPQERKEAELICEHLEGLPLALDQAASYLGETGCALSDYLDIYHTHRKDLLARRGGPAGGHPEPVAVTWLMALDKIEQTNPAAVELLRFCAFLHPKNIPESMMINGADALGPILQRAATDRLAWNKAIAALLKYSLITRNGTKKLLTIHSLVQAVILDDMPQEAVQEWAGRALRVVSAAFPKVEQKNWQECEQLLPHVERVAQHLEQLGMMNEEAGRLLHETAFYLQDRARYAEAELLFQQARHIREQCLGSEHPDVAASLFRLAEIYRVQNKYKDSEPLFQQALRIREQDPDLGSEHPDVADSLAGLANLYRDMQRFTEAKQLYNRARVIFEHLLGSEYPQSGQMRSEGVTYARVLNNLGALIKDEGGYAEAELLYRRAWDIFEQQLGRRHHLVAFPVSNLAILCKEQHRYAESGRLYRLALEIYEEQLGPEHPQVALSCNNLAEFYKDIEKYDEAEPLYKRALHIWRERLDAGHYLVGVVFNNLADIYCGLSRDAEAESFYEQALDLFEQRLGKAHYFIAYTLRGMGKLYFKQEQYTKAERLFQRALAIRKQAWVSPHHEIAESVCDLAELREAQGNTEEAAEGYAQALAIYEQAPGMHRSRATETRRRFIDLLRAMGRDEEVARLEVIQGEQSIGEEEEKEHPEEG